MDRIACKKFAKTLKRQLSPLISHILVMLISRLSSSEWVKGIYNSCLQIQTQGYICWRTNESAIPTASTLDWHYCNPFLHPLIDVYSLWFLYRTNSNTAITYKKDWKVASDWYLQCRGQAIPYLTLWVFSTGQHWWGLWSGVWKSYRVIFICGNS